MRIRTCIRFKNHKDRIILDYINPYDGKEDPWNLSENFDRNTLNRINIENKDAIEIIKYNIINLKVTT